LIQHQNTDILYILGEENVNYITHTLRMIKFQLLALSLFMNELMNIH